MTAEELHAYLRIRFSDDVVQDVIVDFLTSKRVIRHPKTWGWKAAVHFVMARRRAAAREFSIRGRVPDPMGRNPEQVAEVRQELAAAFKRGVKGRRGGHGGYTPGRAGGPKAWREDYQALLKETS